MIENGEMIKGTGGKPEYLVIHKGKQVWMGLKPVFDIEGAVPPVLAAGVRIRVIASKDSDIGVADVGAVAPQHYPFIPFSKAKQDYASMFMGTLANPMKFKGPAAMWDQLEEAAFFDDMFAKLDELFKEADFEWAYDLPELHDFIKSTMKARCDEMSAAVGEKKKPEGGADVIPLHGKDKDLH